jgi:hypothetical protein
MKRYVPLGNSYRSQGSNDDRPNRTAGMRAKSDARLAPMPLPMIPRLVRRVERLVRR